MREILFARNLKILWASRHPLVNEVREALLHQFNHLTNDIEIHEEEILWPSGKKECAALVSKFASQYNVLTGVWPAQAIEAFNTSNCCFAVLSPVSEPVYELDGKKVREFKFVRWAKIL